MTSTNTRVTKVIHELRDILLSNSSEEAFDCIHALLLLRFLSAQLEDASQNASVQVPPQAQWPYLRRQFDAIDSALEVALKQLISFNTDVFPSFLAELTPPMSTQDSTSFSRNVLPQVITSLSIPLTLGEITKIHNQLAGYVEKDRKVLGTFSEPMQLSRLLAQLLEPSPTMTIHDPTCGLGNTLLAFANAARDASQQEGYSPNISGQDVDCRVAARCYINLYLNGVTAPTITCSNTLTSPALRDVAKKVLAKFDIVVGSPPFSLRLKDDLESDPYNRFVFAAPSKHHVEFAFLQHWVAAIEEGGRGAIVVPQGVLFRSGVEERGRKALLTSDLVEAVISLPSNLLAYTAISVAILILNKAKAKPRRDKVLFVDASECYQKQRGQNLLQDVHISRIVDAYKAFADEEGFARVADLTTIAENNYQLSVNLYTVAFEDATFSADVLAKQQALETAERALAKAQKAMDDAIQALGFDSKD